MPVIIKSRQDPFADYDTVSSTAFTIPDDENYQAATSIPIVETSDLVERSFIMITPDYNQSLCLSIVKALDSYQEDLNYDPELQEFIIAFKADAIEEIMSCN